MTKISVLSPFIRSKKILLVISFALIVVGFIGTKAATANPKVWTVFNDPNVKPKAVAFDSGDLSRSLQPGIIFLDDADKNVYRLGLDDSRTKIIDSATDPDFKYGVKHISVRSPGEIIATSHSGVYSVRYAGGRQTTNTKLISYDQVKGLLKDVAPEVAASLAAAGETVDQFREKIDKLTLTFGQAVTGQNNRLFISVDAIQWQNHPFGNVRWALQMLVEISADGKIMSLHFPHQPAAGNMNPAKLATTQDGDLISAGGRGDVVSVMRLRANSKAGFEVIATEQTLRQEHGFGYLENIGEGPDGSILLLSSRAQIWKIDHDDQNGPLFAGRGYPPRWGLPVDGQDASLVQLWGPSGTVRTPDGGTLVAEPQCPRILYIEPEGTTAEDRELLTRTPPNEFLDIARNFSQGRYSRPAFMQPQGPGIPELMEDVTSLLADDSGFGVADYPKNWMLALRMKMMRKVHTIPAEPKELQVYRE
jgi:hypothetical protein